MDESHDLENLVYQDLPNKWTHFVIVVVVIVS